MGLRLWRGRLAAVRVGVVTATVVLGALSAPELAQGQSAHFHCFFASDSVEITPRCQFLNLELAVYWERSRRGEVRARYRPDFVPARVFRIEVEGYADRSERDGPALSAARARAVAAFLTINGIPAELVTAQGFGAEGPPVPGEAPEHVRSRVVLVFLR